MERSLGRNKRLGDVAEVLSIKDSRHSERSEESAK